MRSVCVMMFQSLSLNYFNFGIDFCQLCNHGKCVSLFHTLWFSLYYCSASILFALYFNIRAFKITRSDFKTGFHKTDNLDRVPAIFGTGLTRCPVLNTPSLWFYLSILFFYSSLWANSIKVLILACHMGYFKFAIHLNLSNNSP